MVKEMVCSDCGCEDVRLVTETSDVYRKNSPLYYVWVIILVAFMIAVVIFWASTLSLPKHDPDAIYSKVIIGVILSSVGTLLSVLTFLINSFRGYSTETRIIAICPNCGKTWFIEINKKRKIRYRMSNNERDIAVLEKQLSQLKSDDDGKTEN